MPSRQHERPLEFLGLARTEFGGRIAMGKIPSMIGGCGHHITSAPKSRSTPTRNTNDDYTRRARDQRSMKMEDSTMRGDRETKPRRNLEAMAEPADPFVRLKSIAVVSVMSDGVLCFANEARFCIPWGELRHPPPRAL